MKILVLNSGSSSLKYKLFQVSDNGAKYSVLAAGNAERIGLEKSFVSFKKEGDVSHQMAWDMPDHTHAIEKIFDLLTGPELGVLTSLEELSGVGHRIVQGGSDFSHSVLVTPDVREKIYKNAVLAPLHNPAHLMGIDAVTKLLPDMKQVTAFDTAIFQAMPPKSYLYGLPREQYTEHKIRRYGAHGLSHGYVSEKTAEKLGKPLKDLKVVTCHIGNGASISAFKNGTVLDTSMGLTPLAGVLMGTRSGDMDPYIPLYIMQTQGLSIEQVNTMMNKQSGLLGLCGSSDMRDVAKGIDAGDANCIEAMDIFVYRIQKYIGSYIAAMNGVDAIVFTAGIGENVRYVRSAVLDNFKFIGVTCDDAANEANETVISTADSKVKALVIHTDEELVIATDTYDLVTGKK